MLISKGGKDEQDPPSRKPSVGVDPPWLMSSRKSSAISNASTVTRQERISIGANWIFTEKWMILGRRTDPWFCWTLVSFWGLRTLLQFIRYYRENDWMITLQIMNNKCFVFISYNTCVAFLYVILFCYVNCSITLHFSKSSKYLQLVFTSLRINPYSFSFVRSEDNQKHCECMYIH